MNLSLLNAFAFTVNDAHGWYAGFDTFGKIFVQQIRNILRSKRMQVQNIFDWNSNRLHVETLDLFLLGLGYGS